MRISASTASSLKIHIEPKHEGVRYPCAICEYAATTPSSLKKHIGSEHARVKYACDKCEYAATTASSLKIIWIFLRRMQLQLVIRTNK